MPNQPSPLEVYTKRLSEGVLTADPVQASAMEVLQRLYLDVLEKGAKKPGKIARVLKKLQDRDVSPPQGVYLHGGVGRGKSMLMDLFFESLPPEIKKRRVHFHEFMIEVHNYLHERREIGDFGDGIDGALPSLASRLSEQARVFCFDEFHVTDVADAMILGRLFTALFDQGMILVATSNWPPERLYEGGLQRERFLPFIDLMKRRMNIVHLDSPHDYRARFLQEEGAYFWPLGEVTQKKADQVFERLTDGAVASGESLTVKGRTILVPAAARGVARFTFAQLCENPHGAEDYLKIAESYHTVFLEYVPKMAYDRRNEAKRLMILIDALYENRTKLIVTADAPADRLYYGHDHAFEFERTVSRLMEMQSAGWLARAA